MKSESIKKIVSMLLVLAVVASIAFTDVASIEVQAATKKVSTSATDAKLKKIPSVKKGTTLVTMKKMHTYVKFKATKTKTYTFTISNIYDPVNKKGAVNVQDFDRVRQACRDALQNTENRTECLFCRGTVLFTRPVRGFHG